MSHSTSSDRVRPRRLSFERLEDRSLPSGLSLSVLPASDKHLDHGHGPPADVAAKLADKHDGGEADTRGHSAGHGDGSSNPGLGDAVGQAADGLSEAAVSTAVQAVTDVARRI